MDDHIISLVKNLPKSELHLHIEGSLEPELMFKLAARHGIQLKYKNIDEIRRAYNFTNLQSFLDIYYEGAAVLQKQQDFFDLTFEYLKRCHQDHVVHTEIFFDPQTHTHRNIDFGVVIEGIWQALEKGQKEWGISSRLIMCYLRHLDEDDAFKTLEQARPYKDLITAVGLDSSEQGNPPEKFNNVFEESRKLGWLTVAHAGEEGPAEYIWQALNLLKVKRIDHGVRCLEDENLVQYLAKHQVPLTVCPLSNVKLRVFPELKEHNLKTLLERRLCVTINSDDPAYFGGYINQNYIETAQALKLTRDQIIEIAKNSIKASFLDDEQKAVHLKQIDAVSNQH